MSRQLRASCDACNQAKVKCSKTQPKCARCIKNGYADCVYGISLRAGKRTNTQSTAQSPRENSGSPRERETESSKPQPQSPMSISIPTNSDVSSSWTAAYSSMDDMDMMNNGLMSGLLDFDPTHGLDNDSLSHSLPFDHCSPFSSQPFNTPIQEHRHHQLPSPPHVFGARSSRANSLIIDPTNGFSNFANAFSDVSQPHACQCFPTVLATLSGLHQISGTRSVTFDVALARNKEAAAICYEAMKCDCTSHCMAVMIFSSLITNIIAIYQVPRRAWIPLGSPSCSDEQTTPSSSASNSVRFTLGAYVLDEEIEERFKTEIVRVELRKVESLIARLKEKYCSNRRYRPDHEDEVCEALIIFLTGKVKCAFEMLLSM